MRKARGRMAGAHGAPARRLGWLAMAGGVALLGASTLLPFAAGGASGLWSGATDITAGQGFEIFSLSCVGPTFCAAGDDQGDGYIFNGTSWSAPVDLVGTRGGSEIPAISCTSPTFCIAGDDNGEVFKWDG